MSVRVRVRVRVGVGVGVSSCLRRLAASGGPCRTAKTPALGRGCSSTAATSPEAKTPAQLVEASVGCTWLGLGLGFGFGFGFGFGSGLGLGLVVRVRARVWI